MGEDRKPKQRDKLRRHLAWRVARAVREYQMVGEGDRLMLCLSGGKDSLTMVDLMVSYRRQCKERFDMAVVFLDHGFPGFDGAFLHRHMAGVDLPFEVIRQNIWKTLQEKCPDGKNMCALCARLRRGALYAHAASNGFSHLALGHHMDDMVETLLLNLFYGGMMKGMPPKLVTRKGDLTVIRPMAFVAEADIVRYQRLAGYETAPKDLCGAGENEKRREIKEILAGWRKQHPGRVEKIFHGMGHVVPSHLADTSLFDF
ncbi:tRNA 2-thiocytidine(32) synthetase TtcA [Desulfoluna butyratoxydans]|uniref:Trna(Ile)-lysidine/2-thiocytidine synthase n-terminal n=1 Tax=Desulfoluna butyratoxydans TaxID=231438 RepID=A0A4U8YZ89_9BACT|nr:tRNA 2-thiocytidine(32) synthetase TtcA [Desulfoluna butyratoxydans]VFQ47003.1 trna(ile)-lysidine/2-thiocytidine synthase n-terminal [Desulfoluna butyratoxydans]